MLNGMPCIRYTPTQWGNYYHWISCDITAAVNLFAVYWVYCILGAAKPKLRQHETWLAKKSFLMSNTLPTSHISICNSELDWTKNIFSIIRAYLKHHVTSKYYTWTLSNVSCLLYVPGAPSHVPRKYRHEVAVVCRKPREKIVVLLRDGSVYVRVPYILSPGKVLLLQAWYIRSYWYWTVWKCAK